MARGFRNLAGFECEPPRRGVTLLGANAQGKTNFLEAIYYPVLFRSFRGSPDQQVVGHPSGFQVEVEIEAGPVRRVAASYDGRKKRITMDGAELGRLADGVGAWLGVAFLPSDLALVWGPASERRQYLDRLLSLASRPYLAALTRYRAALAQRNSALRQGRADLAQAFNGALMGPGAELVQARLRWARRAAEQFAAEFACMGESASATMHYRGRSDLVEPEAWPAALAEGLAADRTRGMTTVGPHRDDLLLVIGDRRLRDFGSTGQQRSAAVALKLIEIETLRETRGTEPVLLLDDVFAELDRERQNRLAVRLLGTAERQVFVTSPRPDELPASLDLPVWTVEDGRIGSKVVSGNW